MRADYKQIRLLVYANIILRQDVNEITEIYREFIGDKAEKMVAKALKLYRTSKRYKRLREIYTF